jgi:uncharacterized protein YodC (DUF2158 family)
MGASCSCADPCSCTQCAFANPSFLRTGSSEHGNEEPDRRFVRGELVQLRSGGPAMTVNSINGDQVDYYWTDSSGQPNADKFPISVLQKFIFSFAFS